ncbi:hypothetical protein JAAARDRAFT_57491 [Jaapia argillacea MUCL 33604]|uniref:Uncharacterized protein n=1 Tax=Jaapia argillacea MUCL 33604 TaxID=933084 RepID=A0A067PXG8_9AGAM|nr:hypothetical protein JAAARDRAFT_57491 [Jaapia argillacea MUCL 33604]
MASFGLKPGEFDEAREIVEALKAADLDGEGYESPDRASQGYFDESREYGRGGSEYEYEEGGGGGAGSEYDYQSYSTRDEEGAQDWRGEPTGSYDEEHQPESDHAQPSANEWDGGNYASEHSGSGGGGYDYPDSGAGDYDGYGGGEYDDYGAGEYDDYGADDYDDYDDEDGDY